MSRSAILLVTPVVGVFVAFFVAIALLFASADAANAVAAPVGLGSASFFEMLGGQTLSVGAGLGAGTGAPTGGMLARTGVTAWPLVAAAAFTLISGGVLLYLRRRVVTSENQRTLGVRSGAPHVARETGGFLVGEAPVRDYPVRDYADRD